MREATGRLVAHMEWADARALRALRTASGGAARAGNADMLERALRIYAHVLGSEHTWISRLNGVAPSHAVWPTLSLSECERLAAENIAALGAYIAGASDLDVAVRYVNTSGRAFESRASDVLLHMATHGAYHRGQVALLVRDAGADPLATDFIVYMREQ